MSEPSCFVIGYGPGIGHGVAKAFGRAGLTLGLLSRNPARQTGTFAELQQAGYRAEQFTADAGDEASLTAGLDAARSRLGDPEVLIYNAVAFRQATPTVLTAEQLILDFRANVAGALVAANWALPAMRARKRGAILFTGGGWSLYPSAAVASTAIGKAGLRHLALMLAEELNGTGVRAGIVTILGQVAAGTAFDPDQIASAFLELSRQPADQFQPEVQFTGR